MQEKVLIGLAEESITPDKSVELRGQFYPRISQYVETPLLCTALAVKTDSEQMVIVSCDLTKIQDNLLDLIREEIKGYKDLDAEKVMINATHSHTTVGYTDKRRVQLHYSSAILEEYSGGKEYRDFAEGDDQEPEMDGDEALIFLKDRISAAIKAAWDNLHPAYYQFGFGRAAIGMCRRVVYDDGTAKMWGDTSLSNFEEMENGNDSGIEIGFIFDQNKKLEGIIANVSCPSQILEHRSFMSSDFWGKTRIELAEKFGEDVKLVTLCGAAGDMCPRDLIRWVEPETPIRDPNVIRDNPPVRRADPSMFDIKGTIKAGRRIAREIIDAYEELPEIGEMSDSAEFKHEVVKMDLPFRKVTITEYENAIEKMKEFYKNLEVDYLTFKDSARMQIYAGTVARYLDQQDRDVFPIEMHVVRFGDVAFATNPFELFLNYGNKIRARSKAMQTFLIQLCNGGYGYLPTKTAEKGSHYSAYVSSGVTGHEGGDMLVRETLARINKMFD